MLKLWSFGHLMWKGDSLEKTLMLGKIDCRKRRGIQRMGWLNGITDSMDVSLSRLQELMMDREAWHDVVHGITKIQTQLSDWTVLKFLVSSWTASSPQSSSRFWSPSGPGGWRMNFDTGLPNTQWTLGSLIDQWLSYIATRKSVSAEVSKNWKNHNPSNWEIMSTD